MPIALFSNLLARAARELGSMEPKVRQQEDQAQVSRKLLRVSWIRRRIGNALMIGGSGPACPGRELRRLQARAGVPKADRLWGQAFGSNNFCQDVKER